MDYIGRSLNDIQSIINDLQYQKTVTDLKLKQAKENEQKLKEYIADGLSILGLNELKDKTASILSSLTIVDEVATITEPKQRKLTQSEMELKLQGYGESLYITEDVTIESKPKTIKANFKRGSKVQELKNKDAIDLFAKTILNENRLEDDNQ